MEKQIYIYIYIHDMQRSVFQVCKVGLEPWGEGAALPPKAE